MKPVYKRKIAVINGNGTNAVKFYPDPTRRCHALSLNITFTATTLTNVDTLAEQLAGLAFTIKGGTRTRREASGTELQDYLCLNGSAHACEAVSTYVATVYIPFEEPWFEPEVSDLLAWNPAIFGPMAVEIALASTIAGGTITVVAHEYVSDDLNALSAGLITWERIYPRAATTNVFAKEIEPRGDLIQASIYPDTGGNAVTQATVLLGTEKTQAFFEVPVASNSDELNRYGMLAGSAAASAGRSSANIFDIVAVRGSDLSRAWDLRGGAIMDIRSASASGTNTVFLVRLEQN